MTGQIVFWQPVLTEHSAHTYLAAANALGLSPVAVVAQPELDFRREQGWTQANSLMPTAVLSEAEGSTIADRLLRDSDAIHLFGSPFEPGPIRDRLQAAARARAKVYLISEPYMTAPVGYNHDQHPWRDAAKALARPIAYRFHAARLRDRISGVFAISKLAVAQFGRLGFGPIYPFGYFLPPTAAAPPPVREQASPLNMAYVGSMIRRKNVSTLTSAIGQFPSTAVALDLYGSTSGAELASSPNVTLKGPIPFGTTRDVLRNYDVLAVPSLHDGWGVVVNEGIEAGCAVLCSEETGASVLVRKIGCGLTFPARSVDALSTAIAKLASSPDLLAEMRDNARRHAHMLTSTVAGEYMARAIQYGQPVASQAPWYD